MTHTHNTTRTLAEQLGDAVEQNKLKVPAAPVADDEEIDEDIDVSFGIELSDEDESDSDDEVNENDDSAEREDADADEESDDVSTTDEPDEDADDAADAEDDSEESDDDFEAVPFAGEISQELTLIVALGSAEDMGELNFQNPFSKKGGVVRELISRLATKMLDLSQRNVLLLTDNLTSAAKAVQRILNTDAVNHIQQMFVDADPSSQLSVGTTMIEIESVGQGYPKLSIDTNIAVNMPALTEAKVDVTVRNLFVYLNKLQEQLGAINLRVVIGFTTAQIIDGVSGETFSLLRDMANDESNGMSICLAENTNTLAVNGFSEEQIDSLFEKFDVVFVRT